MLISNFYRYASNKKESLSHVYIDITSCTFERVVETHSDFNFYKYRKFVNPSR